MKNASAQAQTTEPRITTGDREILSPLWEQFRKLTTNMRSNGRATLVLKIPSYFAQQISTANGNGGGELASRRGATNSRASTPARTKKTAGRARTASTAA